jgi:hypothetical protein
MVSPIQENKILKKNTVAFFQDTCVVERDIII